MKILNIDAFATSQRQISLAGNSYPVEDPSVQQFIDNLKAAEELEKQGAGEKSLSESFDNAVKIVIDAVPSMPEETVRKLKLPAMMAVLQFIRGELDPDALTGSAAPAATPEAEAAEKKPS